MQEFLQGTCRACRSRYQIPASFTAQRAKCRQCGGVVEIARPSRSGSQPASPPSRRPAPEAPPRSVEGAPVERQVEPVKLAASLGSAPAAGAVAPSPRTEAPAVAAAQASAARSPSTQRAGPKAPRTEESRSAARARPAPPRSRAKWLGIGLGVLALVLVGWLMRRFAFGPSSDAEAAPKPAQELEVEPRASELPSDSPVVEPASAE